MQSIVTEWKFTSLLAENTLQEPVTKPRFRWICKLKSSVEKATILRYLTWQNNCRLCINRYSYLSVGRFRWLSSLCLGFAAAHLQRLWVRIPPETYMYVSFGCCVLSSRGLCARLITRPEESYRVWCVWVWSWSFDNEEALAHKRPWGKHLSVRNEYYFSAYVDT